ncbi:hypothetical protein ASC98_13240 [Rhizobacter sp. Root1238]|nr:hypothetical protein ASC88_05540 [Rhizobacter sp. Root29]KQV97090.1 hypothetical protein ASC98_13240 [Rhizobacter sp. Root1238]
MNVGRRDLDQVLGRLDPHVTRQIALLQGQHECFHSPSIRFGFLRPTSLVVEELFPDGIAPDVEPLDLRRLVAEGRKVAEAQCLMHLVQALDHPVILTHGMRQYEHQQRLVLREAFQECLQFHLGAGRMDRSQASPLRRFRSNRFCASFIRTSKALDELASRGSPGVS